MEKEESYSKVSKRVSVFSAAIGGLLLLVEAYSTGGGILVFAALTFADVWAKGHWGWQLKSKS